MQDEAGGGAVDGVGWATLSRREKGQVLEKVALAVQHCRSLSGILEWRLAIGCSLYIYLQVIGGWEDLGAIGQTKKRQYLYYQQAMPCIEV